MFKIIVEKECGCFKKSELQSGESVDNKDDALMQSLDMVNMMNNEFCGKHDFKVQEVGNDFIIAMDDSTSNGCCGGGCGTHSH